MMYLHTDIPYNLDDPLEQGGLLFGSVDGDAAHARLVTGPQPGDDRGTHHISLTSPAHTRAAQQAEAQGWHYLGYWHSHPPGTPPVPSEVDITDFHAAADRLFPHLPFLDFPIITGGVLKCFRLTHDLTLKEVKIHGL